MKKLCLLVKSLIFAAFGLGALLLVFTNLQLSRHFSLLAVQSGSMNPAFASGALILATPSSSGVYKEGDILVFTTPSGRKVTHRVVEVIQEEGNLYYRTKGDANNTADTELVSSESVIGRVRMAVPLLGKLVVFSKTTAGFFTLIVIPAFYIIFSELIAVRDEIVKARKGPPRSSLSLFLILTSSLFFCSTTLASFTFSGTSQDNTFQSSTTFSSLFETSSTTCAEGAEGEGNKLGTAVFSFSENEINLHLILKEASPSASYDVTVNQHPGDCPRTSPNFPGGIVTDSNGEADETFTLSKESGASLFWVALSKTGHTIASKAVTE